MFVGDRGPADRFIARTFGKEWDDRGGVGRTSVLPDPDGVGYIAIVWMRQFRRGHAFDAGVLAHEALHVVWLLLEHLNIYDEETHCYMLQWIIDETTFRLTR